MKHKCEGAGRFSFHIIIVSYDEEDDGGGGGDTATMPGEQERKIGHSIEYLLIFFRCCPTNLLPTFFLSLCRLVVSSRS